MTSRSDTWTAFGPFVRSDPGGKPVAVAASDGMATQIAREHNAHAGLVEACERAYAVLTGGGEFISAEDAAESINAALAAARGAPNG